MPKRNGTGKSNFFNAIQFVLLAPKFLHLRQEERQHLLHEGAGANVMSAFVEVIFDNSDGRLTVDGDEVVLRRTIGVKKDEFFLNRKRVTKQEVSSLLESAGFSKSNPYYIVQQGKVNMLTLMKDAERLNLLKEVAGTKVYEERREEALKIMSQTKQERNQIQERLDELEERHRELEDEKDELKEYQQLDKDRRALEYILYDKELQKARDELDSIERDRQSEAEKAHSLHSRQQQLKESIAKKEKETEKYTQELKDLEDLKLEKDQEKSSIIKNKAKLELKVSELKEKCATDNDAKATLKKELELIDKEIALVKQELETRAMPAFTDANENLLQAKHSLEKSKQISEELYAKQGRGNRFQSVEERDEHLQREIEEVKKTVEGKKGLIRKTRKEIEALKRRDADDKTMIDQLTRGDVARQQQLREIGKLLSDKLLLRNELHEARKEQWRALEESNEEIKRCKELLKEAERDLRSSMPRHISMGLQAVREIVEKEGIRGCHGPLIDNFTLKDPKFRQAVEISAGNSLFHVIVDNDEIASNIMQRLERESRGRITFMPLNKLRSSREGHANYPENSTEVVPLIKVALEYSPVVEKAMEQVFGKKLLARDLQCAARYSESCGLDAITLEGDEVNRKGSMQGGYHDSRTVSKLLANEEIKKQERKVEDLTNRNGEIRKKSNEVDQSVTSIIGEIQKLDAQKGNIKHVIENTENEIRLLKENGITAEENLRKWKDEMIPRIESELSILEEKLQSFQNEIGKPLQSTLTDEERKLLLSSQDEQTALTREIGTLQEEVEKATAWKRRLDATIGENLLRQRGSIAEKLNSTHTKIERNERKQLLEQTKLELEQCNRSLEVHESKMSYIHEKVTEIKGLINSANAALEEWRVKENEENEYLSKASKIQDRLLSKRGMALQRRDEHMRKIQELGSIPSAELEQFKSLSQSIKQLYARLHDCHEGLKKFSHVNKKALDQYVSFNEQRTMLLARKNELDEGSSAIDELVLHLDRQKDEAILRTFKGVAYHFTQVFKELVPLGHGKLVMKTKSESERENEKKDKKNKKKGHKTSDKENFQNQQEDETDEDTSDNENEKEANAAASSSAPMSVSQFEGVQVQVSFTGQGENYLMQQLSGGQKALVAFALIFSIQRCDPAPFYLFDEIDQALDSTYRSAVANLIKRQADSEENPAQFLSTTFRPELVAVADKCYGISHQNKVSNIHVISKDEALGFVSELMQEEEATEHASGSTSNNNTNNRNSGRSSKPQLSHNKQASDNSPYDDPDAEEESGRSSDDGEYSEDNNRSRVKKQRSN